MTESKKVYFELMVVRKNGWKSLYFSASSESKFLEHCVKYYACRGKTYTWREWNAPTIEPAIKNGWIKIYKELN